MFCFYMFLHVLFKTFPRTDRQQRRRTFNFPIYTTSLVFSDVFNGEKFQTAALPLSTRVLLSSDDVFQSQTPDP